MVLRERIIRAGDRAAKHRDGVRDRRAYGLLKSGRPLLSQ